MTSPPGLINALGHAGPIEQHIEQDDTARRFKQRRNRCDQDDIARRQQQTETASQTNSAGVRPPDLGP